MAALQFRCNCFNVGVYLKEKLIQKTDEPLTLGLKEKLGWKTIMTGNIGIGGVKIVGAKN
jgi:hypothetical protein